MEVFCNYDTGCAPGRWRQLGRFSEESIENRFEMLHRQLLHI